VLSSVFGGEGGAVAGARGGDDSSTPLEVLTQSYYLQVGGL
jgi:hypothetical protein